MSLLTEIIGGNLGKLFKDVVSTFKLDPETKAKVDLAIAENEQQLKLKEYELQEAIENQITAEIDAKKSIIVAEMNQGDDYTKRARPTIVYAGLGFIFLIHVFFPILAFFTKSTVPDITLPAEFWWAWGGVCSIWVIGRSAERRGASNKVISMITGGVK